MVEKSDSRAAPLEFRLKLPVRLALIPALLVADKTLLDNFVDFERARAAVELGALFHGVVHYGFRVVVSLMAASALFAYVRSGPALEAAAASLRASRLRVGWILVHGLLLLGLLPLTSSLYGNSASPAPFLFVATLWLVLALTAVASAILAAAPINRWFAAARSLGAAVWCYALVAAVIGVGVMHLSQELWGPAAAITFSLVRWVLLPLLPTLTADPATRSIGTDQFAVEISDECSGLEGIGLMFAFSCAWLMYFRRELRFPIALWLIPLGLCAIFASNILRIAALVLIGNAGMPDVALYGFHSQAGWIAFNLIACGLVYLCRRGAWFSRAERSDPVETTHNPAASYLAPLLALLCAGSLSHALSGIFETFNPLRLLAGGAALWFCRHGLTRLDWRFSWRGPLLGLIVFAIWIGAAHVLLPRGAIPAELNALPSAARNAWIMSRVVTAVIVVPLAEELAYRGYLMRRLSHSDFESVPFRSVSWFALGIASIAFGLAHGAMWLPGITAGMLYGVLVVRTGSMGEAVVAHATTNVLIVAAVLAFDQWQLW